MQTEATKKSAVGTIFVAAAWFGLLTGLVEGIGLWALQQLNLLAGKIQFLGLSTEVIWLSPIFNLLLFGFLALIFSILAILFPRLPVKRLSILTFASLMFLDWLAMLLMGRLSIYAIVLLALGLGFQFSRWLNGHETTVLAFWRKTLPAFGALALLALLGIWGGSRLKEQVAVSRLPVADPGSPNILVVVVDTLRADHLSTYGYERPTSPNVDRLAQQGVLFENAYSTSSWTLPAHASLLTGLYPSKHNADVWRPLDNQYPTIGEALQAHGYRTAGFSANTEVFNRRMGFGRGFHHFEDNFQSLDNSLVNTLYGRLFEYYVLHKALGHQYRVGRMLAPEINRALIQWIGSSNERPFFAILNYFDVHSPYIPPQPYRSQFSQSTEPGGLINTDWGMDQIYLGLNPEQLQGEVDAYDGAVVYADTNINQLLMELQDAELAEDTLVVILSDHGESFGEHGLLEHHNSLYPEVIRVPLILWWPDHIPAGLRITTPTTIAALPATLLDIINETDESSFPGPSLRQLWEKPELEPDWPYPIAETEQVSWVPPQHLPFHGDMRSVISSQWQFIEHETFGEELYDIQTDPQEEVNLAQRPDMRITLEQLKTQLKSELASGNGVSR